MVYLAIDYGCYEGWRLEEYPNSKLALEAVKTGQTFGNPWKILREIQIQAAPETFTITDEDKL